MKHRFAFALIALLATTIFLPPLINQHVFTLRDHLDYFQPLRYFTAQHLKAGELPLWNPYSASGEPWLANPQTGVFYPPSWIFLLLPFATAYMLFLLFHLVLLGWGAYLFFAQRASQGAAMVGAVALMFSGPVLSLLDIQNNLATFAWIPLALWCASARAPIRGGFALALAFLGGEPFFAAVAALLYVVTGFSPSQGGLKPAPHRIWLTAAVAFGLSAIQLLPFLELIAGSDRAAGMDATLIFRDSMPLRDWPRIAFAPWSGLDPSLGQRFIPVIYIGAIVVILALIGLTRIRAVIGWLVLLAIAIVIATGPALLAQLPLTLFRYPARVVPLASLAIAAMAVAGWDRIRRERRWLDLVLLLVIVADLLPRARPLLHSAPFRRDAVPYAKTIGADNKILRAREVDPAHRAAWISGYLNLYDRRFDADTAAPIASHRYLRMHREIVHRPSLRRLSLLPAGYVLTSANLPPPFTLIARTANAKMYRNPSARPMAALVTRTGVVIPARWELTASRARVTIDAPDDGVLVLAQQDAPGWSVAVDGKTREKLLIFGLFRGVAVGKGRHEVIWTYRQRTLVIGASMTLITLLAATLFLFVKRSK